MLACLLVCLLEIQITTYVKAIFSFLDCPNLSHPDNGFVTISGRTATFACFPNYNLLGHKQISCTSQGKWTGTKPRCVLSKKHIVIGNL